MRLVPVWRVVEEVLSEKGKKPSPRLVLRVCERVTEDINADLAKRHKREGNNDINV